VERDIFLELPMASGQHCLNGERGMTNNLQDEKVFCGGLRVHFRAQFSPSKLTQCSPVSVVISKRGAGRAGAGDTADFLASD
jgi:hypothetical protein